MSDAKPQPAPEKLSDQVGRLIAMLGDSQVLTGEQIGILADFHRRYLPQLQLFCRDYEYAEANQGSPLALSMAAAAGMRFYRRLVGPCPKLSSVGVAAAGAAVVSLDRFRRQQPGSSS